MIKEASDEEIKCIQWVGKKLISAYTDKVIVGCLVR